MTPDVAAPAGGAINIAIISEVVIVIADSNAIRMDLVIFAPSVADKQTITLSSDRFG